VRLCNSVAAYITCHRRGYGDLELDSAQRFTESRLYKPRSSPYSSTKQGQTCGCVAWVGLRCGEDDLENDQQLRAVSKRGEVIPRQINQRTDGRRPKLDARCERS